MPRSATDATRFTSTTPHASAKPPPSAAFPGKNIGGNGKGTPGPPGESPMEKVRRLRAAADRAREAQITTFDKIIIRGRVWADRAHRITTLTLIGATFIAGGVTVYALGDMMIHNRRKRAEFWAQQAALKQNAVHTAKLAIESGTATEGQIKFIEREKEHEAWLEARKNKKGIFKRSKEWIFGGLKKEEEGEDVGSGERRLGWEALSEEDDSLGERESDIVRAIEDRRLELQDKVKSTVKKAFDDEKEKQRFGGPLDRIGTSAETEPHADPQVLLIEKTESDASAKSKGSSGSAGWFSWVTGR